MILYSNNDLKIHENSIYENPDIENIINNSKKYLYKEFANCVNEKSKEDILDLLLNNFDDEIKEILEDFRIVPHLWKYAFAKSSLEIPYYLNEEKDLGIVGDYFNHNNLDASLLSSQLLGNIEFKK